MSIPSIGMTVHYQSYGTPGGEFGSKCRAAIVTDVILDDPRLVSLTVLNPSGFFFQDSWQDEETRQGGTWHHFHAIDDDFGVLNGPAEYAESG